MVKVFITGIEGLLGSTMANYLTELGGYEIVGIDSGIGGVSGNIRYDSIIVYRENILNTKVLTELMQGVDVVFHTAALPYEGLSVWSPTITSTSIVSGTLAVAMAALQNEVRLFINCSSMARYGDQIPPFTEDMPTKPVDPYGLAKVQAEENLALLSEIHGLNYVTVVPHNVIGVGQRYFDPFRNVIGIMINRVLQNKSIVIYGDGEQKRSFSDATDCIRAIHNIMSTDKNICGQVFNIGPDNNELSINAIADKINTKIGFPESNTVNFPDRPREVKNAYCSSDKIKKEFDYSADVTLDETLDSMIEWIKPQVRPFEYHIELEYVNEQTPKTWVDRLI